MTKKKIKLAQVHEGKNGWSEWIYPISKKYLLGCCDCGLVHEVEFKAFVETNQKRGRFEAVTLPWPFRVMLRAKRKDNLVAK